MALSAFEDKAHRPTQEELASMMGKSADLWRELKLHLQSEHGASKHGALAEEWSFPGAKFGWSLRIKDGKRVLVYLTPCKGHFLAGFVLGGKAVAAAHASRLPRDVVAMTDGARAYAEGRGVRLEVRTRKDLDAVRTLASIKMSS
jgi:hypothetical protein